jgi:hypothetical protein
VNQLVAKIATFALMLTSCLLGFVISELGYRVFLERNEQSRWKPPVLFYAFSNSIWDFDESVGFTYRPNAWLDSAVLQDSIPTVCSTIVTDPLGSVGVRTKSGQPDDFTFTVLGASFTVMMHNDNTWPDLLGDLLEKRYQRPTPILNLARDAYGVLQMFDMAAQLAGTAHPPKTVIIAITALNLVTARSWRMTFQRNGRVDVFASIKPSTVIDPTTHVRAVFVDPRVRREWCEESRDLQRSDETARGLAQEYVALQREDEAFFGRDIKVLALDRCYLCSLLRGGQPQKTNFQLSASHALMRFQDDDRFAKDIKRIHSAKIPIILVYLPYWPELRDGHKQLSSQEASLLESLKTEVDRYIDLTPDHPMGDAALPLTLMPYDVHASYAGLEYYAKGIAGRM